MWLAFAIGLGFRDLIVALELDAGTIARRYTDFCMPFVKAIKSRIVAHLEMFAWRNGARRTGHSRETLGAWPSRC